MIIKRNDVPVVNGGTMIPITTDHWSIAVRVTSAHPDKYIVILSWDEVAALAKQFEMQHGRKITDA